MKFIFKVVKVAEEGNAGIIHPDAEGMEMRQSRYHYANVEVNNETMSAQIILPYERELTKYEEDIVNRFNDRIEEILEFREKALREPEKYYRINPRTERKELWHIEEPFIWKVIGENLIITPEEANYDDEEISHIHYVTNTPQYRFIMEGWLLDKLFN
jgi:hypothetical protein